MLKNFNGSLVDELVNEIHGKKSSFTKLTETQQFIRDFLDCQLTKKIINGKLKHVVMLIDKYNDADIVENSLKKKGYFVNSFFDQYSAESRIVAHKPDIIIVDVLSNKFDGYEVIEKAKRLYPNTIAVAIMHNRQISMIDMTNFSQIFDNFFILPITDHLMEIFPPVKRETAKERLRKKVRVVQAINRLRFPPIPKR